MTLRVRQDGATNPVTLAALAAFPDQLEAHFAAFAPEFVRWAPASWDGVPSEPLTALEQLCHVRDIEVDGYQLRIRRTLSEASPLLASIDTDALVRERACARDEPARALAAFRAARARTLAEATARSSCAKPQDPMALPQGGFRDGVRSDEAPRRTAFWG